MIAGFNPGKSGKAQFVFNITDVVTVAHMLFNKRSFAFTMNITAPLIRWRGHNQYASFFHRSMVVFEYLYIRFDVFHHINTNNEVVFFRIHIGGEVAHLKVYIFSADLFEETVAVGYLLFFHINRQDVPVGMLAADPVGVLSETGTGIQHFDWLADLKFKPAKHAWGSVEEGFLSIYALCSADVRRFVQGAGAHPVIATGHSLGGALSTLAAADLVQAGVTGTALYNFASPRTGDPQFARTMTQRVPACWRVVNTEDIVTTVPLATVNVAGGTVPTLSTLGLALRAFNQLDYMHVGVPVSFMEHKGSIVGNHDMTLYDHVIQSL